MIIPLTFLKVCLPKPNPNNLKMLNLIGRDWHITALTKCIHGLH